MYRKSIVIYSIAAILFVITMFLLIFLKIDTYDKALLVSQNNVTKVIMDEKSYLKIKNYKSIIFSITGKKYQQKVVDKYKEEKFYCCVIDNLKEFNNKVIPVNLKTGTKRIIS